MGKRYIDEKLAYARRRYIEDMIDQRADKGVWKGKVYSMVPYTVDPLAFRVGVPDLLLETRQEDLAAIDRLGVPFSLMVSMKERISLTFYATAEGKIYGLSEIHLLFGRLFPGSRLSPMESAGGDSGVHFFEHIHEGDGTPFLHTIFIFGTGNRQILGHLSGEAQEWEYLARMRDKILPTVERRDLFARNNS